MMNTALLAGAIMLLAAPAFAQEPAPHCAAVSDNDIEYIVCRFDPQEKGLRLFLKDEAGEPYRHFNFLKDALAERNERLVFAMNAGMYHEDRAPVGLYVEKGEEASALNDNDGPGNFHLKPNGVFFVTQTGEAGVLETQAFKDAGVKVGYATQSGPMLVIDGEIHRRFLPDSDSLKRRNGVGVTEDGETIFVLSDSPVRFYDFATFFRERLKTPNALYLDGTISRIYAPEIDRNDPGVAMGPIVGAVAGARKD